jgi:hypothetical protein
MNSINTEFEKRHYARPTPRIGNLENRMMNLGKISPLAFSHMKQRAISIAALNDLITHGQVEKQFDGAQVVYLDSPVPSPSWTSRPQPRLYAVMDAAGDVLTVEKRVRLRG